MARPRLVRVLIVVMALVVVAVIARACVEVTDPFCQRGYIAADGTCAWE